MIIPAQEPPFVDSATKCWLSEMEGVRPGDVVVERCGRVADAESKRRYDVLLRQERNTTSTVV